MAAHVALVFAEGYRALRRIVGRGAVPPLARAVRVGARAGAGGTAPSGRGGVDPYLVHRLADAPREQLICLYYDAAGAFRAERTWRGSLTAVVAERGQLLRDAVDRRARYLVLAHNHPSGASFPSAQDIEATRHLHRMCASVGIVLVDHAIVARGGAVLSFRQLGLL